MDHHYIEQHSLPDRYLDHALPPGERAAFEAHLVDCQECTDRILLAEMFHNRNGVSRAKPETPPLQEPAPLRARLVFTRWQFVILMAAALLLLVLPCGYFLWELHLLR